MRLNQPSTVSTRVPLRARRDSSNQSSSVGSSRTVQKELATRGSKGRLQFHSMKTFAPLLFMATKIKYFDKQLNQNSNLVTGVSRYFEFHTPVLQPLRIDFLVLLGLAFHGRERKTQACSSSYVAFNCVDFQPSMISLRRNHFHIDSAATIKK